MVWGVKVVRSLLNYRILYNSHFTTHGAKLLFVFEEGPEATGGGEVPEAGEDNLYDEDCTDLAAVGRAEGVECGPITGDGVCGVEEPEEGDDPAGAHGHVPQPHVAVVEGEAVDELGDHGEDAHHQHKHIWRRGVLVFGQLVLDEVAHEADLHAGEEELHQPQAQDGQVCCRQ
ncbi:hypothetical protein TRICI_004316 [Trichomonascus ciferrii]|uniref:Uncharacterized protein n=1 Tax=Trichomonascus ciferrii TaxID=44093 RepID=A0A642V1B6_9ASCO|nr:hypothetical protein TRICI_004316 [Trichomonascus ciferrii]